MKNETVLFSIPNTLSSFVLKKIRDEIEDLDYVFVDVGHNMPDEYIDKYDVLFIIDKYIKYMMEIMRRYSNAKEIK